MLLKTKRLCGKKVSATDGGIGVVTDLYFDDQSWAIRYLVVKTGAWLAERRVLLSPHAVSAVTDELIEFNLTRARIENSPRIEEHKPVSRQYEEEYYRYYGWPTYWDGGQLWGMGGFPVPVAPPISLPPPSKPKPADRHLQSTQTVDGYGVEGADGTVGRVSDFLVNPHSWDVRQILVETGHWFAHREIPLAVGKVARISYEDSTVFIDLTRATILATQEYLDPAEHTTRS